MSLQLTALPRQFDVLEKRINLWFSNSFNLFLDLVLNVEIACSGIFTLCCISCLGVPVQL
jgi:hypothetical protein